MSLLLKVVAEVIDPLMASFELGPCDSARLLFDTAPIDPTARRISQALDITPEGLSRVQITALFSRHVSKERIDLALEQLMTLGLINRRTAERGWSATLWAKVQNPETGTDSQKPTHMAHKALTAHIPPIWLLSQQPSWLDFLFLPAR